MKKRIVSFCILALLCCATSAGALSSWLTVNTGGVNCTKYDNSTAECPVNGFSWLYLYIDYTKGSEDNITLTYQMFDDRNPTGNYYDVTELSSTSGQLEKRGIPFDNSTTTHLFFALPVAESAIKAHIVFTKRVSGSITVFGAINRQ